MVGEQKSEYYIEDALAIGELDAAWEYATNEMAAFGQSPFACINDQAFTNSVKQVADDLAAFIENESQHMTIRAIYTETNGFAWNTDLWFFNWFAYSLPVGHPDHEFGCWQSNDTTMHTLEGMENLQLLYTNRSDESGADDACEQCIILRFFKLIIAALETFEDLPFPVVLSSHDCGFEFEVRRKDGKTCLLYTSPSPRDLSTSRMPSSA